MSVWREIVRLLPAEDTLYLADQAHVPYGRRTLEEVRAFAEAMVCFLLDRGVKTIVVACNTISAAALYELRAKFPEIPFVGMEPAVKPAAERTRSGVIGVIATQVTFQGKLFDSLLERYANHVRVITQSCPGLVEAVEAGELDTPATEALLRRYLEPLVAAGVDQLVLGCTHYPFLRPAIERILGSGVAVIDPSLAVARQTGRVLAQHALETNVARSGHHILYTSGDILSFSASLSRLLTPAEAALASDVRQARWRGGRLEAIL